MISRLDQYIINVKKNPFYDYRNKIRYYLRTYGLSIETRFFEKRYSGNYLTFKIKRK